MIDDDMHRLDERALDRSLSRLEADIWQGVAARAQQREAARRTTSFQSVIMIFALLGSIAAGLNLVPPAIERASPTLLASGIELMPSSLLLGERR